MSSDSLEDRIKHWTRSYATLAGTNTPEDSSRFVELFNSIYARKIFTSYYDWRFFNKAVISTLLITINQSKMIGACGYNLLEMKGAGSFKGALILDLMVDAKYRGTGLVFAQLYREAERNAIQNGAACLYLLPNKKGAAAWLATEGWVRINRMKTCLCETRSFSTSIDIREIQNFNDWVDAISDGFSRSHPSLTFTKRTAQFLNWRFVANPLYKYSIYAVYLNGVIFGYLVLKVFHDPVTGNIIGDIVDILWSDDNSNILKNMLEFSLTYFYKQGVKQASAWLQTNTILDHIGHEIGFKETEQIRDFCYKPHDQNSVRLADPKSWFITLSDSEVY